MTLIKTLLLGVLSVASAQKPIPTPGAFKPLKSLLDSWAFTDDFAVSIGVNRNGVKQELFAYGHGNLTLDSHVATLSTSKWPAAMALAGAVKDGAVSSLDDLASKYVPWWTKNQSDPRSRVTFRHLLSFTSGFGGDEEGQEAPASVKCLNNGSYPDFDGCAKNIYEGIGGPGGVNMSGEPGSVFCYNSYQVQLAAAIVTRATGLNITEVLNKYLYTQYNMTNSFYYGENSNPQLAVGLITTGRDYANFLSGVLGYEGLGKDLGLEAEKDYTPFLASSYSLYGDYGFGHYLYCFDSVKGRTEACVKAKVHADPGGYGFFPLIDRRYDYYMELVAYEHTEKTYPRSGIPEYLMQLIKPLADAIMRGENISVTAGHATPEFMGLTLADTNYIASCYLHPEYCGGSRNVETPFVAKATKPELALI